MKTYINPYVDIFKLHRNALCRRTQLVCDVASQDIAKVTDHSVQLWRVEKHFVILKAEAKINYDAKTTAWCASFSDLSGQEAHFRPLLKPWTFAPDIRWKLMSESLERPQTYLETPSFFFVRLVLPRLLNQLIFHADHPPKVCTSYLFVFSPMIFFFHLEQLHRFVWNLF